MQEIPSKTAIAERIRSLRVARGHSQAFLAGILQLSRSNYSQIELGNQFPTYEVLHLLSLFYQKSYEWLIHGTSEVADKLKVPDRPAPVSFEQVKIPLVEPGMQAHYLVHGADETFISSLPSLVLPATMVKAGRAYRAFVSDNGNSAKSPRGDVFIAANLDVLSLSSSSGLLVLVTDKAIHITFLEAILVPRELVVCHHPAAEGAQSFTLPLKEIREAWLVESTLSWQEKRPSGGHEKSFRKLEKTLVRIENDLAELRSRS